MDFERRRTAERGEERSTVGRAPAHVVFEALLDGVDPALPERLLGGFVVEAVEGDYEGANSGDGGAGLEAVIGKASKARSPVAVSRFSLS